jgi:hypothetical protein
MTTEYNGRSAIDQLALCPKDISNRIYDDSPSSKSLADLLLNTNVSPKDCLNSVLDH